MIIYNLKQHTCITFSPIFCIKALGTATYILFNLNNYLIHTLKMNAKPHFILGPLLDILASFPRNHQLCCHVMMVASRLYLSL